jgi:hypothetical protein
MVIRTLSIGKKCIKTLGFTLMYITSLRGSNYLYKLVSPILSTVSFNVLNFDWSNKDNILWAILFDFIIFIMLIHMYRSDYISRLYFLDIYNLR